VRLEHLLSGAQLPKEQLPEEKEGRTTGTGNKKVKNL
jgi:hypothetical protein